MKGKNIQRGKRAFQSGLYLETQLNKQFRVYKKSGLAYIDKISNNDLITRLEKSYLKTSFDNSLRVDFIGYTKAYNGKTLSKPVFTCVEAKQCLKDYLPFSMIRFHQIDYLHKIYKLNGISFIIAGFPDENIIIRLWIDDYMYNRINGTISHRGTFSKGIKLDELLEYAGEHNIYDYQHPDILGIMSLVKKG